MTFITFLFVPDKNFLIGLCNCCNGNNIMKYNLQY